MEQPRTLEYVPLDGVKPAKWNPKSHEAQLIRDSIEEHGFVTPMVLDDRTGELVAGHGRRDDLLERRASGAEPPDGIVVDDDGVWLVPVVRGWRSRSKAQAEKFLVADNATSAAGGVNAEALATRLAKWHEAGQLRGTGYTPRTAEEILAPFRPPPPLPDEPDLPAPPAVPVTNLGDVWVLGDHRLLCGSATDAGCYDRVLGGEHLAGAVVTDPPYGVDIGAKNRTLDSFDRAGQVLTDLDGDGGVTEVEPLWRATFAVFHQVLPPGTPYYIFGPQGGGLGLLLLLLLTEAGLQPRHQIVWVKSRPSFSLGRLDYDYQHEPIVYGWRPGAAHPWHATTPKVSILRFDKPHASPLHPTMKPVDLLAELIGNSTEPGGMVLDPFAGSGSTLIAAHFSGRRARLIEIDPHYCDVICRRWQAATGLVPVLEATGEAHDFGPGA